MTNIVFNCRKKKHQTREAAEEHLKLIAKNDPDKKFLEVYFCYCESWHVGHSKSKPIRDKLRTVSL